MTDPVTGGAPGGGQAVGERPVGVDELLHCVSVTGWSLAPW
ncbi:hypothetical protein ACIRVK_37765 [Streptomyces sp. NPDC101152]